MKKIFKISLIIFAVLCAALLLIPSFISTDTYKDQIEVQISKEINGDVSIEKLSFSVFPSIGFKIKELNVMANAPFNKQESFTAKNVSVEIPLSSLFASPKAEINIRNPLIRILEKSKSSNLKELFKKKSKSAKKSSPPSKKKAASKKVAKKGPQKSNKEKEGTKNEVSTDKGFFAELIENKIRNARLSVFLNNGRVEKGGLGQSPSLVIEPINIGFEDVGIDREFPFFLELDDAKLNGSFKANEAKDFSAKINAKDFRFEALSPLFPEIDQHQLKGAVDIDLDFKKRAETIVTRAAVHLKDVSGKSKEMKSAIGPMSPKILLDYAGHSIKLQIPKFHFPIGGSNFHLSANGSGSENDKSQIVLNLSGDRLNLDELLGLEKDKNSGQQSKESDKKSARIDSQKKEAPKRKVASKNKSKKKKSKKSKALDQALHELAPQLDKLFTDKIFDKIGARVSVDLGEIVALGNSYDDVVLKSELVNRQFKISQLKAQAYQGSLDLNAAVALIPKNTAFSVSGYLKNINVQDAVERHAPEWKEQISGTFNGTVEVRGRGLRKEQIDASLDGKVLGEVKDGKTKFPVKGLISDVLTKLNKKNSKLESVDGSFKTLQIDSTIEGRKILLKKLNVDFVGSNNTTDIEMDAKGEMTFEQKIDLKGMLLVGRRTLRWPEAEGKSKKAEIPFKVKGRVDKPKPDLEYTAKILGPKLLKKTATREASKQIKKKLGIDIEKKTGKKLEKLQLKDLKKLF